MSDLPEFRISVDQNPYLPVGGRDMHAIVSVEARSPGGGPPAAGTEAAEAIVIDTSGSMSFGGKMAAAKRAAVAAVEALRDGVHFAVVAGANRPRMVFPQGERLVRADERTRQSAVRAVRRLDAAGGTAIGSWLRLADRLLAAHDGAVRHAILLTDGKNQHETGDELGAALRQCEGRFVCDARGVGTDWEVAELRRITSVLLGGFLDVPDPADLEADFLAMTRAAMGKRVADVALRVWTPQAAELRFVKQMVPAVEDLTGRRVASGERTGDYPVGAWGSEAREYHLCVRVPASAVGQRMRAAHVKLVAPDGAVLASGNVLAEWTDDEARSTRINRRVAHHTGQSELAAAVREGLEARRAGDEETATKRLGRAVVLAREVGNEQIAGLLDRVVEVVEGEPGTVRLRPGVAKADEMALDTRSVRTVRTVRTRPGRTGDHGGEPDQSGQSDEAGRPEEAGPPGDAGS
ncbi:VWA domain-containing protein [Actinomadura sp. WMMB 499]|uniref:VWA domain-containing protein n=1 Tax=Actinomadura sp. WMMB 499 TaxID=1219491 RepID=UPI001244F7F5|nr:VWA domain-containing protein [Actinomadura sp. WMMB 499]QFG22826.1 VWA domain-containing protein [Actinomadura sp. WMMB 499]